MTVPVVSLNNGVEMPLLGFGVFQIPAWFILSSRHINN